MVPKLGGVISTLSLIASSPIPDTMPFNKSVKIGPNRVFELNMTIW